MLGAARSERLAAVVLFIAAMVGLALANSPLSGLVVAVNHAELGSSAISLRFSVAHWVEDGLLAAFFAIAAIELRAEFRNGALAHPRAALVPAIAAAGGVVLPALLYLGLCGSSAATVGWPVPIATDIAFALGAVAMFGTGLPPRVRALLLGIAVLDDLAAILVLAIVFTDGVRIMPLLLAAVLLMAFAVLVRFRGRAAALVPIAALLGIGVWYLVYQSGIHATIAGVVLGLALPDAAGARVEHALRPAVNLVILPVFALSAALVTLPSLGGDGLGPVFWAVMIALPLGKLLGIAGAGWLAQTALRVPDSSRLIGRELLVVASVGGTGFTVSLLMAQLAFRRHADLVDQATLGVLAGTAIALLIGVVVTRSAVRPRPSR